MIWFIIFPLLFAVGAYVFNAHGYYKLGKLESLGWAALWSLIGAILACVTGAILGSFLPHEEKMTGQLNIVALADATHTEGRFYLFGGSIESEPVYRYYYRSNGGYKMGWKPVGSSLIIESETETPRYDKIEEVRETDWWGFESTQETRYIFYVPPGTVTNDFNLDLEG